jgi:hypothetical protein
MVKKSASKSKKGRYVGTSTAKSRKLRASYADSAPIYVRHAANGRTYHRKIARECSTTTNQRCRVMRLAQAATNLFIREDGKGKRKRLSKAQWQKVFATVRLQTSLAIAKGRTQQKK